MKKQDIKQIISDINWYEFHERLRSPFFHQLFLPNILLRSKKLPFDNRLKNFGSFLNHVSIDQKEMKRFSEHVVAYLKENPYYLLEFMQQGYKDHNEALKEWVKIKNQEFNNKSNKELAEILKKYVEKLLSFGIYVALPLFVEEYMEQKIKEDFDKRFKDKSQYWFNVAVNPVKEATVLKEELAILDIAKKPEIAKEDIQNLVNSFSWMKNTGYFEEYYDESYYLERIEEAKKHKTEQKDILEARKKHKEEFNKLLDSIDEEYTLALVKTVNEAVYFRSYRTEMFYSSARFFTGLFKEIAKRLSISDYKEILWLYWEEIYDGLIKEEVNLGVIGERKQGYAFMIGPENKFWHWEGKDAEEIFKSYQKSQKLNTKLQEIKGSPGYPGKIVGNVVVLTSPNQKDKVKKGDILVVHATNVNFVPILKKVSAIVTEEGGILSHAAIISRELMIPSVIGTKIATKVFKDGDLVEVNANEGIVKLVKKKKD